MELTAGSFYALLGKNGSGKSTLLKLLMRYEQATEGKITIFGQPLREDPHFVYQDIGYVAEVLYFPGDQSIQSLYRNLSKFYPRWNQSLFESITNNFKIDRKKSFKGFSRGQKTQILFSAALAAQPKLLLIDEVTAVLDPHARTYVMTLMDQFKKQGGTVVMATNIATEVQNQADSILILDRGKLVMNLPTVDASKRFIKLRRPPQDQNGLFEHAALQMIYTNLDGSASYLAPTGQIETLGQDLALDHRGITIEEIFIYYSKSSGRETP